MGGVRVRSATEFVPESLTALAEQADAEGIRVVRAIIDRWESGEERYDRSGEQLLVAVTDDGVVGVGGLTICPTVPDALRVRRFYVHPAWRRRGVAAAITSALLASWPRDVSVITCNAQASAAAPRFWEAMGFEPVADADITHVLRQPAPSMD
ncbi:MAG TPA: GNAT family N-acetyltransferase [Ilumatobacteraceae bacterium]|nr:GNAT family N-acetyltransferase [Ilumatobacteraceae bacterium]